MPLLLGVTVLGSGIMGFRHHHRALTWGSRSL